MPFPTCFFCRQKPKVTRTLAEIDAIISRISKKLREEYPDSEVLITKITLRKNDFVRQIRLKSTDKQQSYIEAYHHFATSLEDYIIFPNDIHAKIKDYHKSSAYCHVGFSDDDKENYSYKFADKLTSNLLKLSFLLVLGSIAIMPFNLPIGMITLGLAIVLMGPCLYYSLAVTRPNRSRVEEQEIDLFLEARNVVKPIVIPDDLPEFEPGTSLI